MPAPRSSAALPEWTKTPDIAPSTPAQSPIAAKTPAKKNDGVIQVVQGAASFSPPASFDPPPSPPVAARPTSSKRNGRTAPAKAAAVTDWNDPFAEGTPTKTVATRDRDRGERFTPAASVTKKEPTSASRPSASAAGWSDPFADAPETRKATRRTVTTTPPPAPAAPTSAPKREKSEPAAHPPGWKDPFTKAPSEPARTHVAMRELGKNESSKWEIATHRGSARASSSDSRPAGGWSVLKKRR
jgi:hypothetical protein